ncbi:hypothetical protein EDB86DRAFT_2917528 [Lactarius hatsudake]|nr:hypothetical protein EDB86DRAFT_2917528 [Lactarius hatsudake]
MPRKLEVTWLWCRGASAMLGRSRVAPGRTACPPPRPAFLLDQPGRRGRQAGGRLDDGLVQRAGVELLRGSFVLPLLQMPVPTQWMGRRACGNESPGSDAVVASS